MKKSGKKSCNLEWRKDKTLFLVVYNKMTEEQVKSQIFLNAIKTNHIFFFGF